MEEQELIHKKLRHLLFVLSKSDLPVIKDNTAFKKLEHHINDHLSLKEKGNELLEDSGFHDFILKTLTPKNAGQSHNLIIVSFALTLLGLTNAEEQYFLHFRKYEVYDNLIMLLPSFKQQSTLYSGFLDFISGLLSHEAGLKWSQKHELWDKALLPSLRSPSIFVQRQGIQLCARYVILLRNSPQAIDLIKDLELLGLKFYGMHNDTPGVVPEELVDATVAVAQVVKEIFCQMLGKEAIYSKLSIASDITKPLIICLSEDIHPSLLIQKVELLMLAILHRFQENVITNGAVKIIYFNSLAADFLSIIALLLKYKSYTQLIRGAGNFHKYWNTLSTNFLEIHNIDMSSFTNPVDIALTVQTCPITATYDRSLPEIIKKYPERKEIILNCATDIYQHLSIREQLKSELRDLCYTMKSTLETNRPVALKMCKSALSSILNGIDYLTVNSAVIIFHRLILLLMCQNERQVIVGQDLQVYKLTFDLLRLLIERFSIDWRKSFVTVTLMHQLCDSLRNPHCTTQIKVTILKTVHTCVDKFTLPAMAVLESSETLADGSIDSMGQVLLRCLSERDWEVRDSALEVLHACMTLAKTKYPYFENWYMKFGFSQCVLVSLKDEENYVKAAALNVLAAVVSFSIIWVTLSQDNLLHEAISLLIKLEDTLVHRSAVQFLEALYSSDRLSHEETEIWVMPVIQKAFDSPDEMVRSAVLQFIQTHFNSALKDAGMLDGDFPNVIFSQGKIVKLDYKEKNRRISSVIEWICKCGYVSVMFCALEDPTECISSKARQFLLFLDHLITHFNIEVSQECEVKSELLLEEKVKVECLEGEEFAILPTNPVAVMEDILKTSDLSLSSDKIVDDSSSFTSCWVDVDVSALPLPSPPVPLHCLISKTRELQKCTHSQEKLTPSEMEFSSLIDTVLLYLEGHKNEEYAKHSIDCY